MDPEVVGGMLTLLLTLSLSQADFTPPPMPPAETLYRRSASLLGKTRQPRVEPGALLGRMALATGLGLVGSALGGAAGAGAVYLGIYGGVLGGIAGAALVLPLGVGLGILGVALGSALFGKDFAHDFADALTVAGLTVPIATALAFALLLISVPPLLAIAVPFLAATLCTPLIVQARKPMAQATQAPMREEVPMSGLNFQL